MVCTLIISCIADTIAQWWIMHVFKGKGALFSNDGLFLSGCTRIQVEDIISGNKW